MSDSLLQCIILCFGAFEYSAGTQHGRDVEQGDLVYSASQLTVIKKERVLVEGGGTTTEVEIPGSGRSMHGYVLNLAYSRL